MFDNHYNIATRNIYMIDRLATSEFTVIKAMHDDKIARELFRHWTSVCGHHEWKHFPRYWPFVNGINQSPVGSPSNGQWLGPLNFFFFLCAPEITVGQTVELMMIWDAMVVMWRHCDAITRPIDSLPCWLCFWAIIQEIKPPLQWLRFLPLTSRYKSRKYNILVV